MSDKVTMELVKKLREKTQVGMMDCKKALILADGDMDKAIEILRKKGASVAAKRAENLTNNGKITVQISPDNTVGAMVEVSCETDFSANTKDMQEFSNSICSHLLKTKPCCTDFCDPKPILSQVISGNKTGQMLLDELIAKIAESIKISRCARLDSGDSGIVNAYVHPGATLATMVELDVKGLSSANKEKIVALAKELCMQITVTNPLCLESSQLDPELIKKEECIAREQFKGSDKPEAMIQKIVQNKVNKFYEEVCLFNQKYIKEEKISVTDLIKRVEKETNSTIKIKAYKRFAIGV